MYTGLLQRVKQNTRVQVQFRGDHGPRRDHVVGRNYRAPFTFIKDRLNDDRDMNGMLQVDSEGNVVVKEEKQEEYIVEPNVEAVPAKKKRLCCPLCSQSVIAFKRHLRGFHKFSNEAAKFHGPKFNCKPANSRGAILPHYRLQSRLTLCPYTGCTAIVKRIDKHLRGKHRLKTADPEYARLSTLSKDPRYKADRGDEMIDPTTSTECDSDGFSEEGEEDADVSTTEDDEKCADEQTEPNVVLSENILNEVVLFSSWLHSFGGGGNSPTVCNQIRKRVLVVLRSYGDDFSQDGVSLHLDDLERNFIRTMLGKNQASTVKNHLLALKKFISWGNVKKRPWLSRETADMVDYQITIWNQSLGKLIVRRSHEKKD